MLVPERWCGPEGAVLGREPPSQRLHDVSSRAEVRAKQINNLCPRYKVDTRRRHHRPSSPAGLDVLAVEALVLWRLHPDLVDRVREVHVERRKLALEGAVHAGNVAHSCLSPTYNSESCYIVLRNAEACVFGLWGKDVALAP